ncbi:MAG: DUF5989 family protein [Myxococcota bacterium]|nr:DUF5989 family protein [Myxococcota bacterium]
MRLYSQTIIELTQHFLYSRYRWLLPLVIALSVFASGLHLFAITGPFAPFLYPLF